MSGPPDNVEAAELWRKLQETPRPSEVVDFPRKDGEGRPIAKLRIQVLTLEQHDEARLRAQQYLREERKLKLDEFATELAQNIIGDAVACELLALACVSVKPFTRPDDESPRYARMFAGGSQLRERLAADEIATLFTLYLMVQRKFGPHERSVETQDDINNWVRRLAEGGRAYPLASLDSLQLAELTTSLAVHTYTLCRSLESQLSSLPPTLVSDLRSWNIGTGFFGALPDSTTLSGGDESADDDAAPMLRPGEAIDVETASAIARKLSGSG